MPNRPKRLMIAATCFLILVADAYTFGIAAESEEYKVKLAFIFNFARFIEWPPQSITDANGQFCFCILGDDPFEGKLGGVESRMVGERKFVVKRIRRVEEAMDCQMLFVSLSEKGRVDLILRALKGSSILTISDTPNFTRLGGMIGFTTSDDKIRFEINLTSARSSKLEISSKLLKLAETVREDS
ncbi:MAG: YfiR family protein [Syntrophobacteraceae bacterium]